MNWTAVEALTAVVCAVSALIASWSALSFRAALASMRADMAEARSKDREELREWINGSFMRTKVVEAEMSAFTIRLDHIEGQHNHRMYADTWKKAA